MVAVAIMVATVIIVMVERNRSEDEKKEYGYCEKIDFYEFQTM